MEKITVEKWNAQVRFFYSLVIHMLLRIFLLALVLSQILGCLSYNSVSQEMLKPGYDNYSVSFYKGSLVDTNFDNSDSNQFNLDLETCIFELKASFGKPEDQNSGQDQIVNCMKEKEWSSLGAILLKH